MSQDAKSGSSRVSELAQPLVATGNAHHEAFTETDGFDPDWAIWYADHAQDQVNSLLGTDLSRAELVYESIGLSREQPVVESSLRAVSYSVLRRSLHLLSSSWSAGGFLRLVR